MSSVPALPCLSLNFTTALHRASSLGPNRPGHSVVPPPPAPLGLLSQDGMSPSLPPQASLSSLPSFGLHLFMPLPDALFPGSSSGLHVFRGSRSPASDRTSDTWRSVPRRLLTILGHCSNGGIVFALDWGGVNIVME